MRGQRALNLNVKPGFGLALLSVVSGFAERNFAPGTSCCQNNSLLMLVGIVCQRLRENTGSSKQVVLLFSKKRFDLKMIGCKTLFGSKCFSLDVNKIRSKRE